MTLFSFKIYHKEMVSWTSNWLGYRNCFPYLCIRHLGFSHFFLFRTFCSVFFSWLLLLPIALLVFHWSEFLALRVRSFWGIFRVSLGLIKTWCPTYRRVFIIASLLAEGVYVDTNGKLTKNVVIQWGEVPTSVAYISTGQLLGWGLKAIEVRSAETGHLDGVFMHKREQKFKFLCERNDKVNCFWRAT